MVPTAEDSTSVIVTPSLCSRCASEAAVIQPAVPPPTMTTERSGVAKSGRVIHAHGCTVTPAGEWRAYVCSSSGEHLARGLLELVAFGGGRRRWNRAALLHRRARGDFVEPALQSGQSVDAHARPLVPRNPR